MSVPPEGGPDAFIGLAKGSVEAGLAELTAKVKDGKVHHFVLIVEDGNGEFEYQLWGGPMSVDRLLRYAEEMRLWADRNIAIAAANRKK